MQHVWYIDGGKNKELQEIRKVCSLWRTIRMYTLVMAVVFHGKDPRMRTYLNRNPRTPAK
jgi:hypothetical protein